MEVFVIWIALSIVAGVVAGNKRRSSFGFFLLSLILSPLVGILAAFAAKPGVDPNEIAASNERMKCPFCAEQILKEAKICKHCGKEIKQEETTYKSTVNLPGTEESKMASYGITFDGRHYYYQDYQYDKAADAIAYAEKQRSSA